MMDDLFPMFMTQLWQVTLLAIFVWIVTKTCCKRRPHLGHALWLLVLIKCVVPPVFGSSASIYSWLMTHDNPKIVAERFVETAPPTAATITTFSEPKTAIAKPVETVPVVPIVNSAPTLQTPPSMVIAKRGTPAFVTPADSVQRSVAKSTSPQVVAQPIVDSKRRARSVTARALSPTPAWHSWIIKAWLLGATLFLTITVLRYLRFRSWIKRQKPVEANDIESQVSALAKKLKLRRKIRVNIVDAEFGPAVVGLLHPTIVLPNSIVAGKAAEELEPILGHELIHLRRGDIYWSVLQVVACSLMWFNPLVWLASRNVTRESEKCCDEETIANFQCDRANYARVLVDILEQKSRLKIAPVVPGVRPADITSSRLERIMESSNGICRRTPKWIWALTLLIAIVVLPGAAMVRSQENGFNNKDSVASKSMLDPRSQTRSKPVDSIATPKPTDSSSIAQRRSDLSTYLGMPDGAIADLRNHGRIVAPISNSQTNRIIISDRNVPKSGPTKPIASVLQGDQLVFQFTKEQLNQIGEYSFECRVKDEHKGKFNRAAIEYLPALKRRNANGFKPGITDAQFEASILAMTTDEDEQKKIQEELKDKVWRTFEGRLRLRNCKSPQVDLKIRFVKVPKSLSDSILPKVEMAQDEPMAVANFSQHQISAEQLQKFLDSISDSDNASISPATTQTFYAKGNIQGSAGTLTPQLVRSGIRQFSILDPSKIKLQKTEHQEGATLHGAVNEINEESISFKGLLTVQKLQITRGRKLPLKIADKDIRIETPNETRATCRCEWDLPDGKVQVFHCHSEFSHELQTLLFVEASRTPALVDEGKDLSLETLLAIKKDLPAVTTLAAAVSSTAPYIEKDSVMIADLDRPNAIAAEQSSIAPNGYQDTEAKTESSKPLSLVIQCGEMDKKRSLNTKIGLANDATLTVEGEVESQQISVGGVQVKGKNFVFKNEEEGSFAAKADNGSISFNRDRPLEDTLRLSLQSNAKLQFAGVEFSADSIECWPDRIEADGNVNVSIPEISSKVSAGRVVMNLKSLAFDFDGDVKVERNVDGASFPFLVKGKHVGWSLITGEMQMDVRYSPSRSRQRVPIATTNPRFGGGTQATNGVQSGFGNGFTVPSGKRIGIVPPKQNQPRSRFGGTTQK